MAAIRPALASLAVRVLCTCGERLWLSTMTSAHWEQGHFDTPDPCDGGHDWATRVTAADKPKQDCFISAELDYYVRISRGWPDGEQPFVAPQHVFCVRPGCVAKASDALAGRTA